MRISDWSSDVCSSDLERDAFGLSLRKRGRSMPALLPVPPSGTRAIFNIHDIVRKKELCMSDSAEKVKEIVVEHLCVEADKVTEEASFIDDLGADSLDIVELVMAFEEEFGVEIPDAGGEKIATVKEAIDYIEANKG